jgi:hypothetical protein
MSDVDYEHKFREVARLQHAEIERLHVELNQVRAENRRLQDWIMGDEPDALTALQRVYSDPAMKVTEIVKSAAAALPFERAKPAAVSVVVNFNERLRTIRLAQLAKDKARWAAEDAAKTIEHQPLDLDAPTPETILGGDDSAA